MPDHVDVILHIGTGKTGTTTVQEVLGRSRAVLAEGGTLYPRAFGRERHVKFGFLVAPERELVRWPEWRRAGLAGTDPMDFRRQVRRRLRRELTPAIRQLLISDEALYRRSPATLDRVRRFVDARGGTLRVLLYLRRQDQHLASNYQEVVKAGETRRMSDWVRADETLAHVYDYYGHVARWRDRVSPTTFVVRPFEPPSFVGGSLVADFVDAAGLDVDVSRLAAADRRNTSLGAEAVEFLRLRNIHQVEDHGLRIGSIRNRPFVKRLAGDADATLTLPDAELDAFLGRWSASNRKVASAFLPDLGGQLFRADPRPDRTTSAQFLDPARVHHFLERAAVPEAEHAAIHRIAEREASR